MAAATAGQTSVGETSMIDTAVDGAGEAETTMTELTILQTSVTDTDLVHTIARPITANMTVPQMVSASKWYV